MRLSHAEYRHVPPIEVELIVVANLIILPSDVTMMAYDGINYRIMQVRKVENFLKSNKILVSFLL